MVPREAKYTDEITMATSSTATTTAAKVPNEKEYCSTT